MAHYQQLQFVLRVKEGFPEFFQNCRVLEVGSWDVTGTVRDLFLDCEYTGADVAPGPGVDRVSQAQDLDPPTNYFDAVLSCECFEHNSFWLESFVNMIRMLRPGGLLFMSCGARGRVEHGTRRRSPNQSLTAQIGLPDYYRNLSAADFRSRLSLDRHFACHGFVEGRYYRDLYFVGIKRAEGDLGELCRRLGQVVAATGRIALAPQYGPRERRKRFVLSTVSRSLETVLVAGCTRRWCMSAITLRGEPRDIKKPRRPGRAPTRGYSRKDALIFQGVTEPAARKWLGRYLVEGWPDAVVHAVEFPSLRYCTKIGFLNYRPTGISRPAGTYAGARWKIALKG